MARKKKHEEHVNLERYLISYADFITLLFATFVVLYALSQLDLAKFKLLKSSLEQAFSSQSVIQGSNSILDSQGSSILSGQYDQLNVVPPIVEQTEAEYEEKDFKDTSDSIGKMVKSKDISGIDVQMTDRGLEINLLDSCFFDSGSAQIKKTAYPILKQIGQMLKSKYADHALKVEGHTDNQPMKSSFYPSNWELSASRACSVVRYFISNFNFNKNRFSATGYADVDPIASNNDEKGRNKNRRVQIIVLKNKYLVGEQKIQGINRARIASLKERVLEDEKQQKETQAKRKITKMYDTGVSDAAVNLIYETGQAVKKMPIFQDKYDKQNDNLEKEIKDIESKAKEKSKDKDTGADKPIPMFKKP